MKSRPFENELLRLADTGRADKPLPPVRELGRRMDVSPATVFRALQRLAHAGKLWQHPNGRFYSSAAKSTLHRPKPVACLTRRLELCSELYRELLAGISSGCGDEHRTMLLWHDDLLVNHHDPHEPPRFASAKQQRAILANFLARHGDSAGGFLFDHVWRDEVLAEHAAQLRPSVMLLRRTEAPGLSNLHADIAGGVLQALVHLLGRGFERIVPVEPFRGDPSVTEFLETIEASARALGCSDRLAPRADAATNRSRRALVAALRDSGRRIALLCPEDNVARLLHDELKAARIPCPKQVGLLSVMGTDVATRSRISCVRYDFRAMGRRAVALLSTPSATRETIAAVLVQHATT